MEHASGSGSGRFLVLTTLRCRPVIRILTIRSGGVRLTKPDALKKTYPTRHQDGHQRFLRSSPRATGARPATNHCHSIDPFHRSISRPAFPTFATLTSDHLVPCSHRPKPLQTPSRSPHLPQKPRALRWRRAARHFAYAWLRMPLPMTHIQHAWITAGALPAQCLTSALDTRRTSEHLRAVTGNRYSTDRLPAWLTQRTFPTSKRPRTPLRLPLCGAARTSHVCALQGME